MIEGICIDTPKQPDGLHMYPGDDLDPLDPLNAPFDYTFDYSGGGTYESGEKASFSVSPTTISGEPGVRQVFIGWTSDSHGGYIGPENPAEVVMSNDITEAAQWKIQYYLTLEDSSGGSTTLSSDWYDAGIPGPRTQEGSILSAPC